MITHNDNFVSGLDSKDIVFINSENKNEGNIEALNDLNVDVLHHSLGGVITGLTRLQKNKRVVFVEGEDDITYLKAINDSLKKVHSQYAIDFSKISFWYVRGKDNMNLKIWRISSCFHKQFEIADMQLFLIKIFRPKMQMKNI